MAMSGSLSSSPARELRLVLLGTIGCGKTLSGDTILGQAAAASSPLPSAGASGVCRLRRGEADGGRRLAVVEAPRWYWSGGRLEAGVRAETERALELAVPGPHAFLLLVPVRQFTEVDRGVLAELVGMFGEGAPTHTLVLLTCGDYLAGRGAGQYLQGEEPGLRELIDRCGGRYHVLNNRRPQDREQVRELLEKVENMVQKNGGYYVKNGPQREVEERVMEGQRELGESYRERRESAHITGPETPGNAGGRGGEERERDEVEERVTVMPVANGLQSRPTPAPGTQQETQNGGTPGTRLTPDGALLSQQSEAKSTDTVVNATYLGTTALGDEPSSAPETSPSSPKAPLQMAPPFSSTSPLSNTPSSPTSAVHTSSTPSSSDPSPSPSSSPSPPSARTPELRLVLLGRSGAGKSAAGNAILSREAFASRPDSPAAAVTQECEKRRGLVAGRKVALVDTPDWFCSERTPAEVRAQISSCVALAAPGPHVFLLCVPLHRPAQVELRALGPLGAVFGPGAVSARTLVLFTHADRLREGGELGPGGAEGYIAGRRKDLLDLVERCGDRFHVLERGSAGGEEEEEERRRSVAELMEKVEQTMKEGGGGCYSSPAFQEAESRVRRRQAEIVEERRRRSGGGGQEGRALRPSPEETGDEEMEGVREEAEKSASAVALQSLPALPSCAPPPSFLHSLWERAGAAAGGVPRALAGGALLGGAAGLLLGGGPLGGVAGAAAGSALAEAGRRRFGRRETAPPASGADAPTAGEAPDGRVTAPGGGEKVLKTE